MQRAILGTGDVCRLLGISSKTLERWVSLKLVKPVRMGKGKGNHNAFSHLDVLRLAIARDLRRRGLALGTCAQVLEWLDGKQLDDLRSQWQRGLVYLMVVGSKSFPYLLSREAIWDNPDVDLVGAHLQGVPVAIIDTQKAYQIVLDAVEANSPQPEPSKA